MCIKTRGAATEGTDRFMLIVEAANRLLATSFVLDGVGVILRQDGVSDSDCTRRHHNGAQHLSFDLLELDGIDLRPGPRWNDVRPRSANCCGRLHDVQ